MGEVPLYPLDSGASCGVEAAASCLGSRRLWLSEQLRALPYRGTSLIRKSTPL